MSEKLSPRQKARLANTPARIEAARQVKKDKVTERRATFWKKVFWFLF